MELGDSNPFITDFWEHSNLGWVHNSSWCSSVIIDEALNGNPLGIFSLISSSKMLLPLASLDLPIADCWEDLNSGRIVGSSGNNSVIIGEAVDGSPRGLFSLNSSPIAILPLTGSSWLSK